jgi:nucleotide-binding universal stress UspA family protein
MKTRLVLLIDFSPYTETLIKFAKNWSKLTDAEILLLHQVYYSVPAMTDSDSRQRIINYEKTKALQQLNALASDNFKTPVKTSCKVIETAMTFTLPKILSGNYIDLIIMGTKVAGTFSKFFLGSTTLKVIEKLDFMTAAIPLNHQISTPEILTIATHYKFPLNKIDFNYLLKITEKFIESIQFVSVVTPDDDYNMAEKYLKNLYNDYKSVTDASYKLFEGDSVSLGLKNYVMNYPNTMLVVQKGSRAVSDHLFRKFIVHELINESSLPLIILPS